MNIKVKKSQQSSFLKAVVLITAILLFGKDNLKADPGGLIYHMGEEATFALRLTTEDILLLSGTVAGTLLCMSLDESAKNTIKGLRGGVLESFQNGDVFGDGYFTLGLSGAFYLLGGEKEKKVCENILESFIETGITITVLKTGFGRARPDMGLGAGNYRPFDFSGDSFPSGHTGVAFSTAAVLDRAYGVGIFTYPLAAFTGFCRMYKEKHWLSDVFLGAVIGTAIGNMHSFEDKDKTVSFGLGFNELSGKGMESLNYYLKVKF